jgi:peroxiredoxin Q/BCP
MEKLKVGDQAPDFKLLDQNNKEVTLAGLKGKKVIIYFYPKDDTPGCTSEACNFRDNHQYWIDKGYTVVGISPDSVKSHQNFISKYELPFTLLADQEKNVIKAYGAWGPKKLYGKEYEGLIRSTFVLNEKGVVEEIFSKVNTKEHTEQIIKKLKL